MKSTSKSSARERPSLTSHIRPRHETGSNTARDEALVKRVREALERIPNVKEKKMFGSTAFMVRGRMCVAARAERIMCRIDPACHDAAVRRKGCQAVVMRGREYRGYVRVRADAVKTERALSYWIELALAYNGTLERKPASRPR